MDIKRTARNQRRSFTRAANAVLLSCTAVIALTPSLVAAQDAGSATVLETITVSGTGGDDDSKSIVATTTTAGGKMKSDILDVPASVSVITSKEIQERGAQNIEEVLQYTAGVSAGFYGSDDRFDFFNIRGFDAYAYRDGLTLGKPFGGIREEPYAFERVEVLKGGNSSTFGISDPGGSVNYVTKTPKTERFGEAYVTGGSYARKETGVDFGDNITSDGTLSYRLTGKVRDANAEYDYSRDDEKFFMGGLTWRPTDATNLTVVFDHLNKAGVPGGGGHPVGSNFDRSAFFGEPDFNYLDVNRNTLSVMFDHDFGSGLTMGANARYSNRDSGFGYAYISKTPTDGSTIANRDFFASSTSAENFLIDTHLQYDTNFGDVDSRSLVGVFYNDLESTTVSYYPSAPTIDWTNPVYTGRPTFGAPDASSSIDQKTKAIYFQQEFTFFDKLIATAGIRNDWMDLGQVNNKTGVQGSADLSEFTWRAGLTYKFTDEFSAYGSFAQSAVPAGNLTLEPERGQQFELGVKYRPSDFPAMFSAAIYDLTKENVTVTDFITKLPSAIGEIRVRGLDLEAKAELTNNISLTAAYSYLDAEIVENGGNGTEGNRPQFVPKSTASIWATYLLEGNGSRGDMTFGVGGRYSGSYFFSAANTSAQSSDSAIVFDAAYTWEIVENTKFELNVSNVFDEKHVAYGGFGADFYNPGRTFSATLRRTW